MKKLINYIFHKSPNIPNIVADDQTTMIVNVIGDATIFMFFLACSMICFFAAKTITPKEAYKQRITAMYLLGAAFFTCSVSRGLNVLATINNYYFLNGIFKNLTGLLAICLFVYTPFLIKAIKSDRELKKLKQTMLETSKKVDELKNISNKVLQKEITNNE